MDMTMSSATPSLVEVVTSIQRRRPWTQEQKLGIVKQTNEPGSSVSMVARQFGITAAQLFQWRKAYLQGSLMALGANETVALASELQEAMRRVKQLEGALGRKTLENEILKEAVDFDKGKSGLRARQHYPGASSENRLQCPWRVAQPRIGQERCSSEWTDLRKSPPRNDDAVVKQVIANVIKDRAIYVYRRA